MYSVYICYIVYNLIFYFRFCRYISCAEACWCIFMFSLHVESPSIVRLGVHLPTEQVVYYKEGERIEEVLGWANTTLTEWFEMNQKIQEYVDFYTINFQHIM